MNKQYTILVFSILAVLAGVSTSSALPLVHDGGVSLGKLDTSQGFRVRDFLVHEGVVYFSEYGSNGRSSVGNVLRQRLVDPHSEKIDPGAEAKALHVADGRLVYHDSNPDRMSVAEYDLEERVVLRRVAGPFYTSMRALPGMQHVAATMGGSQTWHPWTELTLRSLLDREGRAALFQVLLGSDREERELAVFDLFLLDEDYQLVKPLLRTHAHEQIVNGEDQRSTVDQGLGIREVRISPGGDRLAAFSNHLPEIVLLSAAGDELGMVTSPGKGMFLDRKDHGSFRGQTVNHQLDVHVALDHLLIADSVDGNLWAVGDDGTILARWDLPFYVVEMEVDGGFLYLRGQEGEFGRWFLPSIGSTAGP